VTSIDTENRRSPSPPHAPTVEGRAFGPSERPLFGFIHHPSNVVPTSGIGVVVCNPFGYEAVCAHRSLRHFAKAAAALRCPALHFDYDGTGDSAGDDSDPDRLGAWTRSIGNAIEEIKQATGVRRVILLGLRFGALLATLASAGRDDIDGLVALAPVLSGRLYLRELRVLQNAAALSPPPASVPMASPGEESLGFRLAPETLEAIASIDLLKTKGSPAPRLLVIDRHDLPGSDKWTARLREAGTEVEGHRLPGYAEMVLDPHASVVPDRMVEIYSSWLSRRVAEAPDSVAPSRPRSEATATFGDVVERPVQIDGSVLVGILSTPRNQGASGRAIVLLNAGAVRHVGPNRLYVALARRWASLGHVVLRYDQSGIGESDARPASPDVDVYSPHAIGDIRLAVSLLRARPDTTEVVGVGLCSGAYHAFKAASMGVPLDGIVPINPLVFFWRPGTSLDVPTHQVAQDAAYYKRSALSLERWRRLLRGEVNPWAFTQTMLRHARSVAAHRLRDLARTVGRPYPEDLGFELEKLAARGVALHFVFASGEAGLDLLKLEGGTSVPRLLERGKLHIDIIEGPDHTFTPMWSHPVLLARLGTILDGQPRNRRPAPRVPSQGAG